MYLGGEKLNVSAGFITFRHPHGLFRSAAAIAAIFKVALIVGFVAFTVIPLSAQDQEPDTASGAAAPTAAEQRAAELQAAERSLTFGGAESGTPGSTAISPGPASFFVILRMILVLILVAAAIYGIVYVFKKMVRPAGQRDGHLRILAGAHLGQNRFVHVISVGTKAWIVGASDGGVNLIAEIEEQEAVDAMLLDMSRREAEVQPGKFLDFRAMIRRLGGAGNSRAPGVDAIHPAAIRQRRDRLKDL
ncbi:hypothetical protein FACS189491_01420 [Spirochaetia bacterium]|nr:hypothetical protein FACS189491_01420 [Spirochaetia bacterium]